MIQDTIVSVAKSYLGKEEIPPNQGFKDPSFETEMKSVGWYAGGSWCAFLGILVWTKSYKDLYPITLSHARKCFSGNSQDMARNFHADATWPTSTTVPKVGALVVWGDGDSTQLGHTGIVIGVSNDGIHFTTIEGNAQPLTSKILTPTGFKFMGDLRLGDKIIDPMGDESHIIGIFPKGERKTYRITLQDGSSAIACDEHLWEVEIDGYKKRKIYNTLQLKEKLEKNTLRFRVPEIKPVQFEPTDILPIEPYLLGLLIGDGCFRNKNIGFTNIDNEINEFVYNEVSSIGQIIKRKTKFDWTILSNGIDNNLRLKIEELGLRYKKSEDKFIPEIYKHSSIENRLSLLQGLMDSDGHVDEIGRVEFTSSSKQLSLDVQELIRSLGGRVSLNIKENVFYTSPTQKTPKMGKTAYRLQNINMPFYCPFRLLRKVNKFKFRNASWHRRISSIEEIGKEEVQCISVSAASMLYVTDNYIPTHNTIPDGNPGDMREGYIVATHTHATNKPHAQKGLNLIRFIYAINEDTE